MIKECACGCGQKFEVNHRWKYRDFAQRFISGHNLFLSQAKENNKKALKTPEHRLKIKILAKERYLNGGFMPSRKGLPSPMKGTHLTDEQKEHLKNINLGKKHSQATKDKCRKIAFEKGYGKWMIGKKTSMETKIKQSNKLKGIMPKNCNYVNNGKYGNVKRGYYSINGKPIFFRSKWEANYSLYLDFLVKNNDIKKWEYEKDCFIFEKIKFGTRSYRPDFKITNNDNTIEYHEVKGYMDDKSKTKLKRMKKYYSNVKIILINSKYYNDIKKKLGKILKFY